MSKSSDSRPVWVLKALVTCAPWIASMYVLYWLEYSGTWSLATPHRGKTSVIILALGMGLSFLAYSRLFDKQSNRRRRSG